MAATVPTTRLENALNGLKLQDFPQNVRKQIMDHQSAFGEGGKMSESNKMTQTHKFLKEKGLATLYNEKFVSNNANTKPLFLQLGKLFKQKSLLQPTLPSVNASINRSQPQMIPSGQNRQQSSSLETGVFTSPAGFPLKAGGGMKIFGKDFPMINAVIRKPQTWKAATDQTGRAAIGNQFFNPIIKNTLPNIFAPAKKNQTQKQNLRNYQAVAKLNMEKKDDSDLLELQKNGLVKWDQGANTYNFVNGGLQRMRKKGTYDNYLTNLNTSNIVLQTKLSQAEYLNYVPKLVEDIVVANAQYSKAGIGPISTKSLPFYTGRFIDPATGRVRLLPKASTKYLNPFSYNAKLSYLSARILNKWNQYVESQSQYLKFRTYQPNTWEKKQIEIIQKKLTKQNVNVQTALKWYKKQYTMYLAKFPVSPSTQIVLGNMSSQNLIKLGDLLSQTNTKTSQAKVAGVQQMVSQQGQTKIKAMKLSTPPTPIQLQKLNKAVNAYSAWSQKGQIKIYNLGKKILKGFIPEKINEEDIQKIDKYMQNASSQINKVGKNISVASLRQIFQNKKKVTDVASMQTQADIAKQIFKKAANAPKYATKFSSLYPAKTKPIAKAAKQYGTTPKLQKILL